MSLYLFTTARRGWLLRASSPEAAVEVLLSYDPALGEDPEGLREAPYPGVTDRKGALARKMIEVPPTGEAGRIYQWGV